MIAELSKQINLNAHAKGFWDKGINIPEKLMLIVSEISEAMEADRKGKFVSTSPMPLSSSNAYAWIGCFNETVKDTFEDELADACIRIFDLAYEIGIDLEYHIQAKMKFNRTRPAMHGGKKY